MNLLSRLSTVASQSRLRASAGDPFASMYSGFMPYPSAWSAGLGDNVPPELALTLSHVYCAVDTISADLGTSTCQMFQYQGEEGRARVRYDEPGIGSLAYKLRWQPNSFQTSKAFWSTLGWQYLLRPACYAEITYLAGYESFVDELIPRHPDRVREERLPRGVRFKIYEPNGATRILTQDEMFVVRNTSTDGLNALSRIQYGSKVVAGSLALQEFTRNYFKHGLTAALIATYKGPTKEDKDEDTLHKSISRYMSGVENAGGLLLVSEDIDVKELGVEPEKAQLLGLKGLGGRDIARLFKMPPSWLGIEGAAAYASQVQDATNYVNRCQVPLTVEFEQAIQRDLIVRHDKYFAKFNLDYLLRADLLSRMQAYEIGIRSRIFWPSEARVREDMSPDERLDRLSEGDNRPGTAKNSNDQGGKGQQAIAASRAMLNATLAVHGNAVRCVRRERAAVEKLARKHAADPDGWKSALQEFYRDHTAFVSQTMRVSSDTAAAYAAKHGQQFATAGMALVDGQAGDVWEQGESDDLAWMALEATPSGPSIEWANRHQAQIAQLSQGAQ